MKSALVLSTLALTALLLLGYLAVQAIEVSGPVSGTWIIANSPYIVTGEINVPANQTLTIDPGVQVVFQGHYKFIINDNATFQAVGTDQDSIRFTAANTAEGWFGLRFLSAASNCLLSRCIIEHGDATGPSGTDRDGGAIYAFETDLTLEHCAIRYNRADFQGGALYLDHCTTVQIRYCEVQANTAFEGVGICYFSTNGSIENNLVRFNESWGWSCEAILCDHSSPLIANNVISYNIGSGVGDGTALYGQYGSNPLIINNEITHNTERAIFFGGGGCTATLINNTICDNEEYALTTYGATYQGYNNIIQNNGGFNYPGSSINLHHSNIQGGWPGVGNIDADPLFVSGPDGDYYLSQPPCQINTSPCVNTGDPASPVITGTTRTDRIQDFGVVDMGYHYGIEISANLDLSLVPFTNPVQIPAQGGSFEFYCFLTNNGTTPIQTDIWIEEIRPDSSLVSPLLGPANLNLTPGTRGWYRIQYVPGSAMPGQYVYIGKAGVFPSTVYAEDSFPFTKLTSGDGPWIGDWNNTGDPLTNEPTMTTQPSNYELSRAFPNPFNPSTLISYELRAASLVNLSVYDISGRKVAELVNGRRDAGIHQLTFDGSKLPSGIYIYHLQAGDFTASGKMALMK